MSISDRHLFNRTYDTKNFYPLQMLSLNDIFRESMRKAHPGFDHAKSIVRCESLPHIKGNREDITLVFEELVRMIMDYPPDDARLFLYVDCEATGGLKGEKPASDEFIIYTIKFRTNILPTENWKQSNIQALAKCRQILSLHNATFHVNSDNRSGCLFSISMPGKI